MGRSVDYIVVGQGLAGSVLSYTLLKRGRKIKVFDQQKTNSSSNVAAGLYNPITGRKLVKTWNADNIFPFIEPFYREMEEWTGAKFLHPIGIYRPFLSLEEQNEWQAKMADPRYRQYLESVSTISQEPDVCDTYGGITLKPSGYVDISVLIDAVREKLSDQDLIDQDLFEGNKLKIGAGTVSYGGIKASKIVFCTGIDPIPYFEWLPFRPVKGEILEISGDFQFKSIMNRGVFVLPKGNGQYRVGATYNWKDLTLEISEEGKKFLIEKLGSLVNTHFEVTGGAAGIRPATLDRRPFIGLHSKTPELGVFNGFGTKGVSLSPYYAQQFFDYLENDKELDAEVNIRRYFSLI